MAHPILWVRRLRIGHALACPVRHHGDGGRVQFDRPQVIAKALQDRLQHPRMGGDVDGDTLKLHLARLQFRLQTIQRGLRTARHAQGRTIDRAQIQIITQQRPQLIRRQADRQHPPRRHRIEQSAAQMHQPDAILETHDPRHAGGGILAHGMPDQGGRFHAPAHPQLRQRIFDDHDQRQLHGWSLQPLIRRRLLPLFGQPDRTDIVIELALQHGQAALHPVAEHRLRLIQILRHARILRAATGEHEDHIRRIAHGFVVEHPARIIRAQRRRRLGMA